VKGAAEMRKAYRVANIAIGSVLIMVLASVSHDIFGDSVWLSRIFLVATTGFIIFCTLLAIGGKNKEERK
jgi:amino acid permease